jgi:hypothetical protein
MFARDRRADEEGEVVIRACGPNLLIEFEGFSGQMSVYVEQYQVIQIGLPQKACCSEALGLLDLDAVTPQNRIGACIPLRRTLHRNGRVARRGKVRVVEGDI